MSVLFEIPDWLLDTAASQAPPDTSDVDPHRVEDLVNRFIAAKQDALFTAPDAYYRTTGRDAVDGAPAILDRLNDLKQATLDAANDDGARFVIGPRLDAHLDDAGNGIDRHVTAQRDALTRQIIGERQNLIQRAAQLEHNNDDKLAGLAEAHASTAQELARMNGEPEAAAMDAARSAIWRTAIDQRLANDNGPQAITLFDQVKNQLAPADHLSLDGPLQVARNDQAANQWIANQTGTDGPPLQDQAAADPTLSPDAKLIVRAKLDARDSARESSRAAAAQALDNQVADIIRILATTSDAYRPGTLARIAHGYDDAGSPDKAAATRRLAMQEAVLVPFAQASGDRQQRQIDSFPDGELRDAAIAIQRQQADAATRAPGQSPEGAADPNIVPVADKPEDDPPYQTQEHLHVEEAPEGDVEHGHSVETLPPTVMGFPGLRAPAAKSGPPNDIKSPAPTSASGAKPSAEQSRVIPRSPSLIGRFLDVHEIPAALDAATAAAKLSREQSKPETDDADVPGLSHSDSKIANEGRRIYASPQFIALESAHAARQHMVVNIGGQVVQYDPNLDYAQAVTSGDHFVMGPKAFASPQETSSTIAHELYRLRSGQMTGEIPSGPYATDATKDAFEFAKRVWPYVLGGRK